MGSRVGTAFRTHRFSPAVRACVFSKVTAQMLNGGLCVGSHSSAEVPEKKDFMNGKTNRNTSSWMVEGLTSAAVTQSSRQQALASHTVFFFFF